MRYAALRSPQCGIFYRTIGVDLFRKQEKNHDPNQDPRPPRGRIDGGRRHRAELCQAPRAAAGRQRVHRYAADLPLLCPLGLQGELPRLLRLRPSAAHFRRRLRLGPDLDAARLCARLRRAGRGLPVPQAEGRRVHRHGRRLPVPFPRPLHQRHHDLPHL